MIPILFAALLTAQAPTAPAEAEKPGVIRGTVINVVTKEPVRKADVTLQPANVRGVSGAGGGVPYATGPAAILKAVTDAEGNFAFPSVHPGNFFLMVQRSGFVPARYGARGPMMPGSQISVRAEQEVTGVRIEMTPQAVISGRVVDEDGEPMQGIMVFALTPNAPPASGAPRRGRPAVNFRGQVATDDRGEFRIANLAPGKVILQISPARWGGGVPVTDSSKPDGEETGYVSMYYPGVSDPNQAAKIEVTAGADLTGYEMRMKRVRVFRVKGKVLDPAGQPPKQFFVSLLSRGSVGGPMVAQQFYPMPEGGFELRSVAPGSYSLQVRTDSIGRGYGHSEPIEVGSQNVEGLVIRMQAPVAITGQVVQQAEQKLDLAGMRVMLTGEPMMPMMMAPGGGMPGMVKEDGTFSFDNLVPGKYRVNVTPVQGGYVESVRYGDIEATGEIEILGSPSPLQIRIRPGGATVSGTVMQDGKPASGIVYLIPANAAARTQMLIKSGIPDQNGAFSIPNIAPGDYIAFALSESDPGVWEDPDEFRAIESKAKKVSLKETSTEAAELTIAK